MKPSPRLASLLSLGLCAGLAGAAAPAARKRIFVVSSYNREYLWSMDTQKGLVAALRDYGYLDSAEQGEQLTRDDAVTWSRAVITKTWMDTKRKDSQQEIAAATVRIMRQLRQFKPDVVLLGDDNAANYIGNQLLDSPIPVVFWGIDGLPVKYGLLDSMAHPGHNVTGVYQSGYMMEGMQLLKRLFPKAETFAILACDSETSRPKIKMLQVLAKEGKLPLRLTETVSTNSFPEFQRRALELAKKVDAFVVFNHDIMKDAGGNHVDMLQAGRWYLRNIVKPDAADEGQFVREGILCAAEDSGYKQSYEAFAMADRILKGASPAAMAVRVPTRGPFMVNRERAAMLGLSLDDKGAFVEEIVDKAVALQ
jgi:ABC-type uncharacterized transport system substrate-binding protein